MGSPSATARLACHENLEALLSRSRHDVTHFVAHNAPAWPLFATNLSGDQLQSYRLSRKIRPYLNDAKVALHSNLGDALRCHGVERLIPSYRATRPLERWASQSGVELLSVPGALQRRLEDKLFFQRFLEHHRLPAPEGRIVEREEEIDALADAPFVAQLRSGHGMEGTFLFRAPHELRERVRRGKVALPLLCRRYVRGAPLGITIVVGAQELLLSAVRRQCRGLEEQADAPSGVQWLSAEALPPAARASIEDTMSALGLALRGSGYRGAANIDFMLEGDSALIIECNPRFSAATPQLSLQPALLHGLDFFAEHCRAVAEERLTANLPTLPDSSYEGTYVDLSDGSLAILKAARRRVAGAMPPLGVYAIRGERLVFTSLDLEPLREPDAALFYYSTGEGERVGAGSDLGALYTNVPLFAARGVRFELMPESTRLIESLREELLADRAAQRAAHRRLKSPPPGVWDE